MGRPGNPRRCASGDGHGDEDGDGLGTSAARSSPALSLNSTWNVSGALGPTGRTVHSPPPESRLWKYLSSFQRSRALGSDTRTSSGDSGQGLEAMALGVQLQWGSETLLCRTGQRRLPTRRLGPQSFSFASLQVPPCSRQSRLPSCLCSPSRSQRRVSGSRPWGSALLQVRARARAGEDRGPRAGPPHVRM